MIDYKALLQKYMKDVLIMEGEDFVFAIHADDDYTEDEVALLNKLSKENIDSVKQPQYIKTTKG